MVKKAAVLVVNPVNGAGLFQYLEAFFENGIPFRTFAVAETPQVTTNSGVALRLDATRTNTTHWSSPAATPCPNSRKTSANRTIRRCSA